jgi:hypothetical protein
MLPWEERTRYDGMRLWMWLACNKIWELYY